MQRPSFWPQMRVPWESLSLRTVGEVSSNARETSWWPVSLPPHTAALGPEASADPGSQVSGTENFVQVHETVSCPDMLGGRVRPKRDSVCGQNLEGDVSNWSEPVLWREGLGQPAFHCEGSCIVGVFWKIIVCIDNSNNNHEVTKFIQDSYSKLHLKTRQGLGLGLSDGALA